MFDQRMPSEVGVRHQRADAQSAISCFLDLPKGQPRNVDQQRRTFDILFHQVDQIGAACNEFGGWVAGDVVHGVGDIGCARVLKIDHDDLIACWMAATMLG